MSTFESMDFGTLGGIDPNDLSDDERTFCVQEGKEMVQISAGDFMMGALEDDEDAYGNEKPRHKVTLTRDFLMGKYAVTQVLWQSVMGSNPSHFKGANRPVECVSWFDCVDFCNKLSQQEGLEPVYTINDQEVTCDWNANGYRLPTEAEWEYSARGGEYHRYSGSDKVIEVGWIGFSSNETHPVGQKKPNGFGLYDMSGNVMEWCWDRHDGTSYRGGQTDPTGPDIDSLRRPNGRVRRGGNWWRDASFARTSSRLYEDPTSCFNVLGFRLSRLAT